MKNKAKTTFLSLLALCAVATVIVYMYYYQPTKEETASIETSNASLATRVATLEKFYLAMPENKAEMERMTAEINDILDPFPVDVKEEDAIYLALRTLDEQVLVAYDTVTISAREEMESIEADVVQRAKIEGLEQEIAFNSRKVTYSNKTTYSSMKDLVNSINANQEELAITNINYSKTDEGLLEGSIDATFFMVSGTGKEYVPKEFAEYETGLTNLFGDEVE
ncbi:MAG: hypothetical protein II994_10020 [Lachnospiraceae bacterium]|nr:hypothetical protein [Lachnospiraceae bacterium]